MNPTKSFFASKTLWGAIVTSLPLVLNLFGFKITDLPAFNEAASASIDAGTQLVGIAMVIWGRLTATKALVIRN
jgi:hypothetical protein